FDSKDLKRLFGIPASQVRSLIRAGHIHPLKKAGRLSYSFQDLIVLRTAGSLRAAKIPAQRINRTLREIRESLPGELPLSGLSIVAVGDRIMVREGQALREGDTGQYTLDLEVIDRGGDLLVIDKQAQNGGKARGTPAARGTSTNGTPSAPGGVAPDAFDGAGAADEAFEQGLELEDTDPAAARAAYEACLAADQHHLEARLNLGRLLHLDGRLDEAEKIYRSTQSGEAILSFNLAVLLEDFERMDEAMTEYRHALALDPGFADAHFNLARLHERAGHPKDALRHLLAYRRLMNDS
ncbi:MAG TPA: tetratricopeptide repeat protein, partial [Steroidobacteraceae bacterium]|nr:tetratricopeptide repeat protein [Steroidobacteraceae bacterium]